MTNAKLIELLQDFGGHIPVLMPDMGSGGNVPVGRVEAEKDQEGWFIVIYPKAAE